MARHVTSDSHTIVEFAPVCFENPKMARVYCGVDQEKGGASHHGDARKVKAQHRQHDERRGEQKAARRLLPFRPR